MMLVLIGAGAMAVDVGQIYSERAQLQNAADAGAMAAAQQCHNAGVCTDVAGALWAEELSGPNSNDGATTVDSVDLSVPNQVTVGDVHPQRHQRRGIPYQDVRQRAQCAASDSRGHRDSCDVTPVGGATAFPLAISRLPV